jgi:hypothetical protein
MSMNMSKEGPHLALFPMSQTQFADYNHVFQGRTTRLVGYLDKQALMSVNKKCSLIYIISICFIAFKMIIILGNTYMINLHNLH